MENLNSLNVIKTIIKNLKSIVLIVIVAAIVSFAASFLIKEKYKSNSIVYPVNLYQNSEESPSEQLLQYFLSDDIKYKLAKDFNLFSRYGIDTINSKGGKALFDYMYLENVKVSPTIYESIEIIVKDEDPAFAQKLNAALISNTNEFVKEKKKNIVNQYLVNTQSVIDIQKREVDSLSNAFVKIKTDYNIVDETYQAKYLSKQITSNANLNENSKLTVKGIKEKGMDLKVINGRISSVLNSYTQIKVKRDNYLLDANGNIDFCIYVSKPNLQDKKCYPVRWIIVLVSSLSSLLLSVAFFLFKNRAKEIF